MRSNKKSRMVSSPGQYKPFSSLSLIMSSVVNKKVVEVQDVITINDITTQIQSKCNSK